MALSLLLGGVMACCLMAAGVDGQLQCAAEDTTFELMTGFVFTSPDDILETRADTLQLADCIEACRDNDTCRALNFETGLCVLFGDSAQNNPGKLHPVHLTVQPNATRLG